MARRKHVTPEVTLESPPEIEGDLPTLPEVELGTAIPGITIEELGPNEKIVAHKVAVFIVAKGRSVTTRARGIVPAGQVVHASDFSGGDARLEDLASAGYLARS